MMEKVSRVKHIGVLYFLGAILVVLGHSFNSISVPSFIDSGIVFLYKFHMPLFFFLSGVLFSYSKSVVKYGYLKYTLKRVVRLLVPYIFWSLLFFIPKYFFQEYFSDTVTLSFEYIIKMLFIPRQNIWGHFWFLFTLFVINILAGIFQKLDKKWTYVLLIFTLPFTLCPINYGYFACSDVCKFLFFYVLGMVTFDKVINIKLSPLCVAIGVLSVASSVVLFVFVKTDSLVLSNLIDRVIALLMIFALNVFSKALSNIIKGDVQKFAFPIFIFGWPIQLIVKIVLYNKLNLPYYICSPCMFVLGVIIPIILCLIYKKFRKINNKFFDIIFGF